MIWLTIILAILLVAAVITIIVVASSDTPANSVPSDVLAGTSTAAQLYNTTTLTKSTNTIGVTLATGLAPATSLKVKFPAGVTSGYYQVVVYFKADAPNTFVNQNWAVPSAFTNCQYYLPGTTLPGSSVLVQNAPFSPITTANSGMMQLLYIKVTGAAPSFQVNVSAPLTSTTTWTVYVSEANSKVANLLT